METQIIDILTPLMLIGIGVLLMALETIIPMFFTIWFGFGFILVGIISYFYHFSDGLHQIALAFFMSLLLLILLRKKVLEYTNRGDKEIKPDFFNEKGEGVIKNGLLSYKGTFWEIDSGESDFKEGEQVYVESTYKNRAKIYKKG